MPVVRVKGVANPMQFPDNMDIDDIREFLRKRFTKQAVEGTQPVELGDRPQMMQAYEPTLQEKTATAIGEGLYDSGIISDRFGAQNIGKNVSNIAAFSPAGAAFGGDEFGRATKKGDKLGMALGALEGVGIGGDIAKLAIFGGVLAKSADLGALAKAKKLEGSGANRDEIWKETGWANDQGDWKFEISDYLDVDNDKGADINVKGLEMARDYGSASQGSVLGHPELYDAYPDTLNIPVSDAKTVGGGSYSPKKNEIRVDLSNIDSGEGLDRTTSINLHEIQHAIQETEGFARGGGPDSASYFLKQNKDEALRGLNGKRYQAESALFDMGKYGSAEYVAKLDRLSKSDNVRPASVLGLSDWYQYSDQIREKFGVMPKTNAKGRNQWLQSAAGFIRNRNLEGLDYYQKGLVEDAIREPKLIKSEYNKAKRQFEKFRPEYREHAETKRKFERIEKMSEYDQYQRLAGEAEARNVEKRMDWTPEQRRATPPWASLDVPEDELIYRKSGGDKAMSVGGVQLGDAAKGTNQYGDDVFNISITKEGKKAGDIQYMDDGKAITILRSDVEDAGKGTGTAAYEQLIDRALSEGKTVKSDAIVSPSAAKVYEKLKAKGYKVEKAEGLSNVRAGETTVSRASRMAQRESAPTITVEGGVRTNAPFRVKGDPVYTIKP